MLIQRLGVYTYSVDVGSSANISEIHAGFCFKRTIEGSEGWCLICAVWSKNWQHYSHPHSVNTHDLN
jgi:hypothetical protein